jgi:hypothetical protein
MSYATLLLVKVKSSFWEPSGVVVVGEISSVSCVVNAREASPCKAGEKEGEGGGKQNRDGGFCLLPPLPGDDDDEPHPPRPTPLVTLARLTFWASFATHGSGFCVNCLWVCRPFGPGRCTWGCCVVLVAAGCVGGMGTAERERGGGGGAERKEERKTRSAMEEA